MHDVVLAFDPSERPIDSRNSACSASGIPAMSISIWGGKGHDAETSLIGRGRNVLGNPRTDSGFVDVDHQQ